MDQARIKAVRSFAAGLFVRIAVALAALFVVIRIAIPYMVDAHNDVLFLGAVALGLASLFAAGWLGLSLWLSVTRFRRSLNGLEGPSSS
ncbi:hypothetical protein ACO2Q3_20465 [Caulobacter sp. KR2-114]|uniref:hypothetical protein n=1 Tax=Caulobacter sp. KR2-114 TaxID=3400912 RepID=UPI003C01B240